MAVEIDSRRQGRRKNGGGDGGGGEGGGERGGYLGGGQSGRAFKWALTLAKGQLTIFGVRHDAEARCAALYTGRHGFESENLARFAILSTDTARIESIGT
jgi:hypothetical protein